MNVELISAGRELLLGNIVNTNAAYVAEHCALLGMPLGWQTVVDYRPECIREALKLALDRSDIIFLVGGMGPNQNDCTKETAAEVLGLSLVEDVAVKKQIEKVLKGLGRGNQPESIWKQAMVPEGAVVIENQNGTAPGLIIEYQKKTLILLPGQPSELQAMISGKVMDYLNKHQPETVYVGMVKACGLSEGEVQEKVRDLTDPRRNPVCSVFLKKSRVHIRVTGKAASKKEAKSLVKETIGILQERLGNHIYSLDEKITLEASILEMLKVRNLTLTTAESLTGGLLAARITSVPGASEVFKQGFVTYCNRAKRKLLDVKKSTLKDYGAVSERTAKEMAKNGAFATGADVCVSLTGLAGPDADEGKPVGLVYIACCYQNKTTVREFQFSGDRERIRENAAICAMTLLRECILASEE